MIPEISKIKGIHPGVIIKREIMIKGMKNKELAFSLDEHAQTISSILKGKRSVTPKLSVKLGQLFNIENEYFLILQACYDVRKAEIRLLNKRIPNLKNIRRVLFWDTDFDRINWIENRRSVIKRIFERGEEKEIQEIIEFYGKDIIKKELEKIGSSFLPSFEHNIRKYIKTA